MSGSGLDDRFREHLEATGWLRGANTAVVGVSGGLDSMTLLYLMSFAGPVPGLSVHAAHLDHRMRARSGADAAWVRRICDEWGVTFHLRTAAEPVRSEAEGRELRYAFFEEVRRGAGAEAVTMTGHTADDQAETVLFRIARGSGPRGLGGVYPRRPPSLVRPLLPFWRRELEAFAAARGIPSREDPSNRDQRWTRNRLRHDILPALEEAVPGAAAALVSLAGTSRLESGALNELLDQRIDAMTVAARPSAQDHPAATAAPPPRRALHFDREALAAASDPVLTLLLRRAVSRLGGRPGQAASDDLLRFVRRSPSGRRLALAGGVIVEHRLGELRIRRGEDGGPEPAGPGSPTLRIDTEPGEGAFASGHWRADVAWGAAPRHGFPVVARFLPGVVPFPLLMRPWAPGDRIEMPYGKKKVKKILLEARIPADRRPGFPVLADAEGVIVWVPGVAGPHSPTREAAGPKPCHVEIRLDPEPRCRELRQGDPA